ncbi:SDR family NAD(P)-dependent oxidoreductase [Chelatococcus reniformis]|uniref:Oxidoreductase n=1 Tax=Chelatococcus reniformis TaxID=1494448 RepID=A0A916UQC9_9HYPH|nr:SDR family oxidoreductase [Chelatococcus reniformis]GGC81587.1 oxidoreductase [Chelatococcus reniformis]
MVFRLNDEVALIFGAGSSGPGWGNGKAAAVAYARAGAKVACVDLNLAAAEETAALAESEGCSAIAIQGNVCRDDDMARAVSIAHSHFGKIDILHNNTGITLFGSPVDQSIEDWDRAMDVNVKSVFLACRHVLPHMVAQRHGAITNISSIASIRIGGYGMASYYTSKAAVNHLTRSLALQYADKGIRCNAILPGLMNTPMIRGDAGMKAHHGDLETQLAERDAMSPTGKMGDAWDVAYAAVFLASAAAKYINGVLLPVDGGLTCRTR